MNIGQSVIIKIVLVIVVIATIYGAYIGVSRAGKESIILTVLPTDAVVTVDGKRVSSVGTIYLAPGKHVLEARETDFAAEKRTITIPSSDYVDITLNPVNDAGRKWVNDNQRLYRPLQERAEKLVTSAGNDLVKTYPIVSKLPYSESGSFIIGYRTSDGTKNTFVITIRASSSLERATAIGQIKKWGYNPADYMIDFVGYTNPLVTTGGYN